MRLIPLLIAKSVAEVLFVATLVIAFYFTAFNANLRGAVETSEGNIAGWVIDESAPSARIEAQLYVDDRFVASTIANLSRPDIVAAKRARDEWHGFKFDTSSSFGAGQHVAYVFAVRESGSGARRTLQIIGTPVRFITGAIETKVSGTEFK